MIQITLQRNDAKTQSDKVWHGKDSITLNGQTYQFPKGKNIAFESPHDQIFDAYRDADGILYATVLKQYIQADQGLFEGSGDIAPDNPEATTLKPITAKIADPKNHHKTVSELLFEKKAELQTVRQQILDAQADEDETLLVELRPKRDQLKKEIQNLEEHNA